MRRSAVCRQLVGGVRGGARNGLGGGHFTRCAWPGAVTANQRSQRPCSRRPAVCHLPFDFEIGRFSASYSTRSVLYSTQEDLNCLKDCFNRCTCSSYSDSRCWFRPQETSRTRQGLRGKHPWVQVRHGCEGPDRRGVPSNGFQRLTNARLKGGPSLPRSMRQGWAQPRDQDLRPRD
jgi:hypothetical protein